MKLKHEIEDIMEMIISPIEPLKTLMEPFSTLYFQVFDTIKAVKESYQILRDG